MLNKWAVSSKFLLSKSKLTLINISFLRNNYLCKKGEPVDFLGIVVHGTLFVEGETSNLKELKIGDMIGHNVISEFTERPDHPSTIKAKTDGLIAVMPAAEIKYEMRRVPDAVSQKIQLTFLPDVQNNASNCKLLNVNSLLQRAWSWNESKNSPYWEWTDDKKT